jgi:hypothetical protein
MVAIPRRQNVLAWFLWYHGCHSPEDKLSLWFCGNIIWCRKWRNPSSYQWHVREPRVGPITGVSTAALSLLRCYILLPKFEAISTISNVRTYAMYANCFQLQAERIVILDRRRNTLHSREWRLLVFILNGGMFVFSIPPKFRATIALTCGLMSWCVHTALGHTS